jgi:D-3-phosphoglycerate dehydrogenase
VKIAVLDDYLHLSQASADWSRLPPGCEVTVFDRPLAVPDEAAHVLEPFHVLCHIRERTPMPRALIERLPNLKLIAITGMYHRTLDVAAANERGIIVSHSGHRAHSKATSELAWGLMLSVARHIPYESNEMKKGGWQHTAGITLAGRTLGLLGLGRQGRFMVPVARAFDMDVIAWSRNLTAEGAAELGAKRVERDELFGRSDVLSVHLVLAERTRGTVGARELSLMKPTAILINTARGPIVDEAALVAALRERRIAGAGLDVYDREPLPDAHPLRTLPNVVLTPHLGYATQEFFEAAYSDTIANIVAFAAGKPIRVLTADRNDSRLAR